MWDSGQVNCWNDPWWSGMIVYLPYKHYLYYGNKKVLETAYEPMKYYVKWLGSQADPKDGLLRWSGASDWIEVGIKGWGPPKRTPTYLVSTCAWYHYTDMLSQISRIQIKPAMVGDLTWVKCSYDSNYGLIVSNWTREDSSITMDVVIPPNTSAQIYVPAKDATSVTESGKPIGTSGDIKFLRMENGAAVYGVFSGSYRFQSTLHEP